MSKQESVSKAEKETIQPYVIVSIEDRTTNEVLYRYDLPRDMFWRYSWVVQRRMARYKCQRPRHEIACYLSFYDKITGLEFGFGTLPLKLT